MLTYRSQFFESEEDEQLYLLEEERLNQWHKDSPEKLDFMNIIKILIGSMFKK